MTERGIPLENHALLRENLASCLSQLDATELGGTDLMAHPRWGAKMARDLAQPYTDDQVFQKLGDLEQKCRTLARNVDLRGAYLSGSIAKGRFGANSDVDLTCDGGFRDAQKELLARQPGWDVGVFKAEFQGAPGSPEHGSVHVGNDLSAVLVTGNLLDRKLAEYDAAVPLEVRQLEEEHGFLADVYQQALQGKGYHIERQDGHVLVTSPTFAPEHPPERSWRRPGT